MRTSALLAAALVVLTLTGCQPDDPVVIPQPEPSSTPLFASEEEALAAAEEAYAGYLAAGADPEGTSKLESFLTEKMLLEDSEGRARFAEKGWHTEGVTTFDTFSIQQFDSDSNVANVIAYACIDVTSARLVDSSGTDVTPVDRPNRLPLELEFVAEGSATLKLDRSDLWSGDDFCTQ